MVTWQNGQGRIADVSGGILGRLFESDSERLFQQLRAAGAECFQRTKQRPQLIVVVLPENGNDIYTAVKQ